jgi:hypothetical protein
MKLQFRANYRNCGALVECVTKLIFNKMNVNPFNGMPLDEVLRDLRKLSEAVSLLEFVNSDPDIKMFQIEDDSTPTSFMARLRLRGYNSAIDFSLHDLVFQVSAESLSSHEREIFGELFQTVTR